MERGIYMEDWKKDFLIAEYNHAANSFWENKQSGEKRVSFLVTLGTAVIAALVTLAKLGVENEKAIVKITAADFRVITLCALGSLLLLGVVAFGRMMFRHRVQNDYKRAMATVRKCFMEIGTGCYEPFKHHEKKVIKEMLTGSLAQMIAAFNGIIVAGLVMMLWRGLTYIWFYAIIAFGAFFIQSLFAACIYNVWSGKDKERDERN